MSILRICAIISVSMIFTACESTGGTIGGLIPAPKFLKGHIKDDTYIAQNNLFSISTPYQKGTQEFAHMKVKEQYKGMEAYVSFGPAAFNQSIYRVEVAMRTTPESKTVSLKESAPKLIDGYMQQLHKGYGTEPKLSKMNEITINGFDAYYWKLTQKIPPGKYMANRSAVFTHFAYVIDFKTRVGIIWVQVPDGPPSPEAALPPQAFAESLSMMPQPGTSGGHRKR